MDYVLAKITTNRGPRNDKMKTIITDATLYQLPNTIKNSVVYSAETLIDECEWYKLYNFSHKNYFPEFLKTNKKCIEYTKLNITDADNISYFCSCQNNSKEFYFQKISKIHLATKKWIHIGNTFEVQDNSKNITINPYPDAIYLKENDVLYFQRLEPITSIFKGIDELYKEASAEETTNFLNNNFISLHNNFHTDKVKKPNRKRIALAIKALNEYDEEQKNAVFINIKEYCKDLITEKNTFIISNEHDLEMITYGILQRFYTIADGRKKLIANSVKNF